MTAKDVAVFFLSLEEEKNTLFNMNLITRNGRTFYEGNARLNKYLHLAQNIYYAKTGTLLFSDDLYAYDNGAVVPSVLERYSVLLQRNIPVPNISEEKEVFLKKFFIAFQSASIDELIELSHEDEEWQEKNKMLTKQKQIMDTEAHLSEYKEQYADIINVMDRMEI